MPRRWACPPGPPPRDRSLSSTGHYWAGLWPPMAVAGLWPPMAAVTASPADTSRSPSFSISAAPAGSTKPFSVMARNGAGPVEHRSGNARKLVEGGGRQPGHHVALTVPDLVDEPAERAREVALGRQRIDGAQDLAHFVEIVAGDGTHGVAPFSHGGQGVEVALLAVRRPDIVGRPQPLVDPRPVPPATDMAPMGGASGMRCER